MVEFDHPPTIKEVIDALSKMPQSARVCTYADERGIATFYVNSVSYDESQNRVVFYPPSCMDASDADEMDAGAGWNK